MDSSRKLTLLFGFSLLLWLTSMAGIYRAHYIKNVDEELGYFSTDVVFNDERRQYFNIYLDGRKIGYKNEAQFEQIGLRILAEEGTLKMNLAGESREVFIQSITGLDSVSLETRYIDFTVRSGEHVNNFAAIVKQDSLIIMVQNSQLAKKRTGVITVESHVTSPIAVPFYLHNSDTGNLSLQIFDPIEFSPYFIHAGRAGNETLRIGEETYNTVRYDLIIKNREGSLWLDENGTVVKSENYPFFNNVFGSMTVEKAMDKNVFLLPVEVPYGNDLLKELEIHPQLPINTPRDVSYLKIELENIRAANIDITAPNMEVLSLNPVIFALYNKPVAQGQQLAEEQMMAAADTAIIGMSDYINPYDNRILRQAQQIVGAEADTLAMARALNQWIFLNVKKVKGLDIVRSVDVLRNLKGDSDEHTKLFTAFGRSLGIPTQIHLGLVYKEGAFRYHSWPSVYAGGTWHDLDPFFGQNSADATHLILFRGDYDKLVELLRIMNFISLKILTYR